VTIAFIGLGRMGRPMALNLVRGGGQFVVSDRNEANFSGFDGAPARFTRETVEIAAAEIIFLSLPDTAAVEDFLFGPTNLAATLRSETVVVDTSTISYGATLSISARLAERGVTLIDAPVSGMQARAESGTLTFMSGGNPQAFARVRPFIARMGDDILYMGETGTGQLAKLVNQLLFDINAAALGEILPMAAHLGLDPTKVAKVINSGTGRSYASEFFVPRILKGVFVDGYPMRAAYKDLVSAAELGAERGIPMPVLAAATATYQQALLKGLGDLDKGGMVRVYEDLLHVRFRAEGVSIDA